MVRNMGKDWRNGESLGGVGVTGLAMVAQEWLRIGEVVNVGGGWSDFVANRLLEKFLGLA
jgi:hypothetical protein